MTEPSDPNKPKTEPTVVKQKRKLPPHLYKPGQSGNPAGRPKGITFVTKVRKKIEAAIDNLDQSGKPLEKHIKDHPVQMMQAMSKFAPKEVNLSGADGGPLLCGWLKDDDRSDNE